MVRTRKRLTADNPVRMDDPIRMDCPCCNGQWIISQANMQRLRDALHAACPDGHYACIDISSIPHIDWTAPVTSHDITAAITAAVSFHRPD